MKKLTLALIDHVVNEGHRMSAIDDLYQILQTLCNINKHSTTVRRNPKMVCLFVSLCGEKIAELNEELCISVMHPNRIAQKMSTSCSSARQTVIEWHHNETLILERGFPLNNNTMLSVI